MSIITHAPPQIPQVPLCSFGVLVNYAGPCVFTEAILVEQKRDDTFDGAPTSFDAEVDFDSSAWDAVHARARWVAAKLLLGGTRAVGFFGRGQLAGAEEIIFGRTPELTFEEGMVPGEQSTVTFQPVGDQWAIPSIDYVPPPPATCPTELVLKPRVPVKSFGNHPTELTLRLGKSPAKMIDFRLFQGQTVQKTNQGLISIKGQITCEDDSILWVDHALCYELPPFAGKRRGEITKDVATLIGMDPRTQVICPIGEVVTKPILLSNSSILAFLNDFWMAEDGFAYFDEYGRLVVKIIGRKDLPDQADWTLDEDLGDIDLEQWEERAPSKPPTTIFVNVAQPVRGTGPGGSDLEVTQVVVEEDQELYNPQCVKVPPSGATSHLLGDGSYRVLAAEELMVVSRKTTATTTRNGLEILKVVIFEAFYNPLAYDPNFDTDPPGTSYDSAYGDKSFHRDEAESLMEISQNSLATTRDTYGTILATVEETKGWYAIHRGGNYNTDRTVLTNDAGATPPAYVYAGGTTRSETAETYRVTSRTTKDYLYGADGSLATITERRSGFLAPTSRCDLIQTITTPDSGPPTDDSDPDEPPVTNPPPPPPPPAPPDFWPSITGPVLQEGGQLTFQISIAGAPPGSVLPSLVQLHGYAVTGSVPFHGVPNGREIASSTTPEQVSLVQGSVEQAFAKITFHGPKPTGTIIVGFQINHTEEAHGFSNNLICNPWSVLPEGGSFP